MTNNKYKLKGANGLYFVQGAGWTGTEATASILTCENISCLAGVGFTGTKVEVKTRSYGVVYIRKGEGQNLLAGKGKGSPNAALGQIDPSKRRFATSDEAWQHGSRAQERRAHRGDKPGTAGHEGFFVVETYDAVNSAVNWKSGLTNSLKA